MKLLFVINPSSGSGAGATVSSELAKYISSTDVQHEIVFTTPGETTSLVQNSLIKSKHSEDFFDVLVAVGGDGTVSEVINGMFYPNSRNPITKSTRLAIFACGTGLDLARVLPSFRSFDCLFNAIKEGRSKNYDVACARTKSSPVEKSHLFMNVLSYGISHDTISYARWLKTTIVRVLGGKFIYLAGSTLSLLRMRMKKVRVWFDEEEACQEFDVCVIAVANGRYFGGGMFVSPTADPCDGLLNVTIWREGLLGFATGLRGLYNGDHLNWPSTKSYVVKKVHIDSYEDSATQSLIEIDGELVTTLPVTVSIATQIPVICN